MQKRQPDAGGHGLTGYDRHAWVTVAEQHVFALIDTVLAAPHAEVLARLWDIGVPDPATGRTVRFFPHILDEALQNLAAAGNIQPHVRTTKGQTAVELFIPGTTRRRETAISRATGRKAMLYARFIRCSHTFGVAGETVVRGSLKDAMPLGYMPITAPDFGEVSQIGVNGTRLYGSLDSGAWLVAKDSDGIPGRPPALLIEVKNVRQTLYPRHAEVHQLLAKAARVQLDHPELPVVPLLICRRGQDRLFWMAKDLGFLAHQTKAQYFTLPEDMTPQLGEEMRTELGLLDLRLLNPETPPRIIKPFRSTIPKEATATAARWSAVGSTLLRFYERLRLTTISHTERNQVLAELRAEAETTLAAAAVADPILAWALPDEQNEPGDDHSDWY